MAQMFEPRPWHSLPVGEVMAELGTSERGLFEEDIPERLAKFGLNELEEAEKATWVKLLLHQLKSPFVIVLAIAAFISLLAHGFTEYTDAAIIAGVITFNTIIGFTQEYKAEKSLEALKSLAALEADVVRGCQDPKHGHVCLEMKVKATMIVPGDIVVLDAGDKVPADARLLECHNLQIDESMLTGESTPVQKHELAVDALRPPADQKSMAFTGTTITRGRCRGIVVATGKHTQMGQIATLMRQTRRADIPIKRRIMDLSKKLGLLALILAAITFTIALISHGVEDLTEVFLFSIASAISAIPEGLPAVITITLAVGVNRMVKRHAIIRKLQAVDTLGSISAICTDKTGTLTTNQMTAREIHVGGIEYQVSGAGYEPSGTITVATTGEIIDENHAGLTRFLEAAILCSDARLRSIESESGTGTRWEIHGDPTEGALVVMAAKQDLQKDEIDVLHPRKWEIPFDSKQKYMVTFTKNKDDTYLVSMKGAPEQVLSACTRELDPDGVERDLDHASIQGVNQRQEHLAGQGMRVLAVASRVVTEAEAKRLLGDFENTPDLTFLGLVGMIDPPRLEVAGAVAACKSAGIHVTIATGDHALTAASIAKELGIMDYEHPGVITGEVLDTMDDDALDDKIGKVAVFARVTPEHKHRIVLSLQRNQHIVAMTGDGINDAPALKAAEVGIAMGLSGTDVAKETADMILTDDNFASIVAAVEEGRVVFRNVRKVTKYLLSTNLGENTTIISSLLLFIGAPLIFTPVQILWVNLVTDGVLDVTLAMEPKEDDVMAERPRPSSERIINKEILKNTMLVAVCMALGSLGFFALHYDPSNPDSIFKARTFAFTTMAMFQVFNALNCRSRRTSVFKLKVMANPYLLMAIAISVSLQVMVTTLPVFSPLFGTVALSWVDWLAIALVTSSVLWMDEARKWIQARRRRLRTIGRDF